MYALIPAPDDPQQWATWREQLHQWRESTRALLNYDDTLYQQPEFDWIPRTFTVAFVMMCDLLFYREGAYQLESFLAHGEEAFGGYDALLLWHAYPRIGFDDRNQFDFYQQMPDGLAGLRQLVDACHARDIKVYVNYNPWDTGTRRESVSDVDALVELVREIDADAIFLDTMSNAVEGLRERLDAIRPGVTLESEMLMPLEHIGTHPSSWAQGFVDLPGVLRNKWFERRHMQHRIRRWQTDHTPELHTAWMNGTGMVVWENVFGTLRLWSERDKSILRGMVGIQRHFAHLFSGEGWIPLVSTLHDDIHASLWQDDTTQLWTIMNRSETTISDEVLALPYQNDLLFFDLIKGQVLSPSIHDEQAIITLKLPPRGIGCVVALETIPADWDELLQKQAQIYARADFDPTPPTVTETLREPADSPRYPASNVPDNMVSIPAQAYDMKITFRLRECGVLDLPHVEKPSLRFRYLHRTWTATRYVELSDYAIDLTPITNQQFAEFLQATGYTPVHSDNFLLHWENGVMPEDKADHPVVYVSLEDARAYAQWAGKRLPTEPEWQHVAEGQAQYRYPWGDDWLPNRCNHGQMGQTTSVTQFPDGRSPYGCYDMCGNVWEWTESEYTDGRNRFVLLKGGSHYQAQGSVWYGDGGAQSNDFTAKFLLMYAGLDRCATIGFRCVVDLD